MNTNEEQQFKLIAIKNNWKEVIENLQKGLQPSYIPKFTLINKDIQTIPFCFRCLISLKQLQLINTNLRKIQNIETLTSLQLLKFGGNKIIKIENIQTLTSLKQLSLCRNNKITKMENLKTLISIENFYFGANKITKIEIISNPSSMNFCTFKSLTVLSLYKNLIATIEGILHIEMPNLIKLSLHDNNISNFDILRRVWFPKIEHLNIHNNKIEYLNSFNELNSQKLKQFNFGEYDFLEQKIQTTKREQILIFKMESLQLEFASEKQRIWKQQQKRTEFIQHYSVEQRLN